MRGNIKVIITDSNKFNELTGESKRTGDIVHVTKDEARELTKNDCVKLSKLHETLTARRIPKAKEPAELSEQAKNILLSPDLMGKLVSEVQKNVAGEAETILTIGLNACGRLVDNAAKTSYNCIPNDESGTGKDYVTENTLEVFVPHDMLEVQSRISPKVLNYWHTEETDPNWSWDGKVLYLKDVSDPVLNSEVMKVFTSDQTKAVILVEQRAKELLIKGKPCVFCTTANSSPEGEMLRRFSLISLDSSEDQTERIKDFHIAKAITGKLPEKDKDVEEAMAGLRRVKVVIPFINKISRYFPRRVITRTVFVTFVDLIKASAALYQLQRKTTEEGFVIAEIDDYAYARKAFMKSIRNGSITPITKNQQRILEIVKDLDRTISQDENIMWSVKEIEDKVTFMNYQNLYKSLESLANTGFLIKGMKSVVVGKSEGDYATRSTTRSVTAYQVKEKEGFSLPDVDEIDKSYLVSLNSLVSLENMRVTPRGEIKQSGDITLNFFPV